MVSLQNQEAHEAQIHTPGVSQDAASRPSARPPSSAPPRCLSGHRSPASAGPAGSRAERREAARKVVSLAGWFGLW